MALHRGDVVLVPFPFTDLSAQKVRPAVIVSSDPQTEDFVLAFISSVVPPHPSHSDFVLRRDHPGFHGTGLKVSSVFKLRKLLTLHQSQILRHLGRLTADIQRELDHRLSRALGLG